MALIGQDMPSCGSLPHLHGLVEASRSDGLAIRRPGHCCNPIRMPMIDRLEFACGSLPHLHGLVEASRSDVFAIWRPGDGSYTIVMTTIGVKSTSYGDGWHTSSDSGITGRRAGGYEDRTATDDEKKDP